MDLCRRAPVTSRPARRRIVTVAVALLAPRLAIAEVAATPDESVRANDWIPCCAIRRVLARRSPANPLITPASSPSLGRNINGPSVIRAPRWVDRPLGRYYMYFAHHAGRWIRLATADDLHGPWRIHEPGTLHLEQAAPLRGHIASPDVHLDETCRRIVMYVHGDTPAGQRTVRAWSADGLHFTVEPVILGPYYMKVFRGRDQWYALAKLDNTGWGGLLRSRDGRTPFELRGPFIERMRHAAVLRHDNRLIVFYSRVGDAPESILACTVDLRGDWTRWTPSAPIEVLKPEMPYEGIEHPVRPSTHGAATGVRQLRDPAVFEEDGRLYLFYTVAGESGIAMAELELELEP